MSWYTSSGLKRCERVFVRVSEAGKKAMSKELLRMLQHETVVRRLAIEKKGIYVTENKEEIPVVSVGTVPADGHHANLMFSREPLRAEWFEENSDHVPWVELSMEDLKRFGTGEMTLEEYNKLKHPA
jgi:hypothetical protein